MKHLIWLLCMTVFLAACEKSAVDETEEEQEEVKLTPEILAGKANGNNIVLRVWYVMDIQKRYFNSQNQLDSSLQLKPTRPVDCTMAFKREGEWPSGAMEYAETKPLLDKAIFSPQSRGYDWVLNTKADTLTIRYDTADWNYIGPRPETVVKKFALKFTHLGSGIGYIYGIDANRVDTLSDGRKIAESFSLGY